MIYLLVAKLTDLVKFFMSAESLVTHFEKKRLLLTTSTVADEKPVPNLAFFESLRAPLIRYSSSMKLYAALRPIYLCTELSTARHLLELITATGYHWPAAEFDTSVKNSIVKFQFTARRVRQKPKENNRNINTVDTVAVSSTDAATHHSSTSSNNNNSVLPSHLPSSPVNRIQTLRRQGQNYTTGSAAELRLNASNSGLAADLRQHQTATTTQLHTALSLTELPRLRGTLPIGSLSDLRTRNNGMIGSSPDKTSSLQQSDANISPNPGTTRNINASEGQLNRPTSSSIPNLHHRRSGSASTNLVNEQDQQRPPVNILAGSLTNLIGRGVSVIPPILNSSTPSSPTNATQSSEVPTAVVPVLPAPAASSQPGPQRTATTSNANQKLYPSSSYCKNIEDFQVFMKSIVADLKSKNDNFNKIEESWSQTVHSLLNGMDAEIAEVANQLQLGSEGVDESAKLSAIQDFIKFKFEASMLDLFPRKFLDASTAIVPLLKTCIETLVRHLGRLDKSYEAPIYPSMDVYNQKNAIKNWAGYKNEISNAKQIAARTQTQTGIRQAFTSTVAVGPSDSPPDYV